MLLAVSGVLVIFENFALLPTSLAAGGKLNLGGAAWFSGLCALLAWLMPGVNAMAAPFSRPDLLRNAPWRRALPWMGAVWFIFGAIVYWYAGWIPLYHALKSSSAKLQYLNTTGVTFMLAVLVIGIILYVIRYIQNRAAGVELALLYREIPPD